MPIEGERQNFWFDPVIGVNLKYRPTKKVEIVGNGDFGPRFLNDLNTYQAMLGVNYLFTKTFLITLGYRAYHIDFPKDEAIFNGNIKGWIMRIGFQF